MRKANHSSGLQSHELKLTSPNKTQSPPAPHAANWQRDARDLRRATSAQIADPDAAIAVAIASRAKCLLSIPRAAPRPGRSIRCVTTEARASPADRPGTARTRRCAPCRRPRAAPAIGMLCVGLAAASMRSDDLKRDAFQCSAGEVGAGGAARQAEEDAACIRNPVRRPQADEPRHEDHRLIQIRLLAASSSIAGACVERVSTRPAAIAPPPRRRRRCLPGRIEGLSSSVAARRR